MEPNRPNIKSSATKRKWTGMGATVHTLTYTRGSWDTHPKRAHLAFDLRLYS